MAFRGQQVGRQTLRAFMPHLIEVEQILQVHLSQLVRDIVLHLIRILSLILLFLIATRAHSLCTVATLGQHIRVIIVHIASERFSVLHKHDQRHIPIEHFAPAHLLVSSVGQSIQ